MLTRIAAKLKSDGLLKTLVFLGKRLIRIQRHQVYIASCADVDEPGWLPGEQIYRSSSNQPWTQTLSRQIIDISPDNKEPLARYARRATIDSPFFRPPVGTAGVEKAVSPRFLFQ